MEEVNNDEETTVRVAVRCRPFNSKEKANNETSCVRISSDQVVLINPAGHNEEHSFAFDLVIDENATQESVWVAVGVPILNKAFNGYNGTIFAYGQTGSGKTWSMQGAEGDDLQGIIPRMNNQLFVRVDEEMKKRPTVQFLITVSYFEIYNEVIFDLLDSSDRKKKSAAAKGGLEIKEHPVLGVYVKGLQEIVVDSAGKLQNIIDQGMRNRTVASTQMNADSSRSHSVFIINLHQKDVEDESKNVFAKVNLVDLAGSERVKSTGATGNVLKEGANINKSLSALGNVINALVEASKGKGAFIPYRNSKLTRVLQESLGGNSITAMLAALSPAACNFEETLSTLKYANRAKAIKVKAIKNEQSSQISKLNDEIKALKEKLMSQGGIGGGGGSNETVDTSALEEKNRQRLKDLEDAMRSTWEAKSKMSEEYERDRQALLIEQQNAARQFEAARQRNWALLEQKGDLEITLSHVKSLVTDRLAQSTVSGLLGQWTEALREVSVLERRLAEQDTVVQVYRNSLEKDSQALLQQTAQQKRTGNIVAYDSTTLSMLRQLREKFSVTHRELLKWTSLQDQLISRMQLVNKQIKDAGSTRTIMTKTAQDLRATADPATDPAPSNNSSAGVGMLSKDEKRELSKGVSLIRKQVQQKHAKCKQSVATSRKEFVDFESIRADTVKLFAVHEGNINAAATGSKDIAGQEADPAVTEITDSLLHLAKGMQGKVTKSLLSLKEVFQQVEQALRVTLEMSRVQSTASINGDGPVVDSRASPVVEEIVPLEGVHIENFDATLICNARTSGTQRRSASTLEVADTANRGASSSTTASVVTVDSPSCWTCPVSRLQQPSPSSSLVLCLPTTQLVSALQLQGGVIVGERSELTTSTASLPSVSQSTQQQQNSGPEALANVIMPSGVSLATVEPRFELTAIALADVLDWTALIKSNQPEKFLKRPPVRFLFDLIRFVGTNNPGFLDEALDAADWAVVGVDKNSKLDFMDKTIRFITKLTGAAEPVTTASAIVTGSDPELTNILLQQLAVALYAFQSRDVATPTTAPVNSASTANTNANAKKNPLPLGAKITLQEAWVTLLRVESSEDGQRWGQLGDFSTGLQAAQQVVTISFQGTSTTAQNTNSNNNTSKQSLSASPSLAALSTVRTRYLRLTPLKWNGDSSFGPAMRLVLLGPEVSSDVEGDNPVDTAGSAVVEPLRSEVVAEVVQALVGALSVLIEVEEFVSRTEEAQKEIKQLEVKKNLEKLAQDKQALESLLASEKKSLESDNQDLAEKLKTCFHQLKETQGLFEKEQEINATLEKNRTQLEDDKSELQRNLNAKEEENAQLRATILSLQASAERDRNLVENIQTKLQESEALAETLQEQLQQAEDARQSGEHEREELQSQIMVLTEERDAARAQEEELFEKLTERSNDLDRLRESYVEITDRWNDAQDENMDLKDKIEALESALESKSFLQTTMSGINHQMQQIYTAAPTPSTSLSTDSVAKLSAHPPSTGPAANHHESHSHASPRGAGSKIVASSSAGAKAVTPGRTEGRATKLSPRNKGAEDHSIHTAPAEGKSRTSSHQHNHSHHPSHSSEESLPTTSQAGSPRKPPPVPVSTSQVASVQVNMTSAEYGDDYNDEYDEEFEQDD